MQRKTICKRIAWLLCLALIVTVALFLGACGRGTKENAAAPSGSQMEVHADGEVLGNGSTFFSLVIADLDGNETRLEIHTDQETVGGALKEVGVIAGEESAAGMYVKTVNGVTADYDTDGIYWAFYIGDAYAVTGVDATAVTAEECYSFRVEKG